MAESSIIMKVDEVKTSLDRLEKLIRERYTQSIQNFFKRSTEQLKREIQTGFTSIASAQASGDVNALLEGFTRFEKELESLAQQDEPSQLAQDFTTRLDGLEKTMGDRLDHLEKKVSGHLDSFKKQLNEISAITSKFTSEIMTSPDGILEIQPGEQISTVFRHKLELKEVLAGLYDYLRWANDPPGSIKAKNDIVKKLEKAQDLAQATHENGSLPLTLRNSAYEVARVISDTKKKISHSDKGRFYAEDMEPIGAPLIRHLKHLVSILE